MMVSGVGPQHDTKQRACMEPQEAGREASRSWSGFHGTWRLLMALLHGREAADDDKSKGSADIAAARGGFDKTTGQGRLAE